MRSTEVMHSPRSDLDISTLGTYSKFVRKNKFYRLAFAYRDHVGALAAGLTHQDRIWITTTNLFRFHNNEFNEIPCKLDSTEYVQSFRKYRTRSGKLSTNLSPSGRIRQVQNTTSCHNSGTKFNEN